MTIAGLEDDDDDDEDLDLDGDGEKVWTLLVVHIFNSFLSVQFVFVKLSCSVAIS